MFSRRWRKYSATVCIRSQFLSSTSVITVSKWAVHASVKCFAALGVAIFSEDSQYLKHQERTSERRAIHTWEDEWYDELLCHLADEDLACGTLIVWVLQHVEYHPHDLARNLGTPEVGRILYQYTHVEIVGAKADLVCKTLLLLCFRLLDLTDLLCQSHTTEMPKELEVSRGVDEHGQ